MCKHGSTGREGTVREAVWFLLIHEEQFLLLRTEDVLKCICSTNYKFRIRVRSVKDGGDRGVLIDAGARGAMVPSSLTQARRTFSSCSTANWIRPRVQEVNEDIYQGQDISP